MHKLTAANGHDMPVVGSRTHPLQGKAMASMALGVFKRGYGLIDIADDYRDETGLGLALSRPNNKIGFRREDMFIQTKIPQDNAYGDKPLEGVWFNKLSKYQNRHTVERVVMDKVTISLRELQTNYIDSLLIRYPFPGYYEGIWDVMMRLRKEGRIRYIGVSNFHTDHLEGLESIGGCPSISQVYVNPPSIKHENLEYSIDSAVQLVTYSSIMDLVRGQSNDSILMPLAEKYRKTEHQVTPRWNIDRGCMLLPRTTNPNEFLGNFKLFDFKLIEEEIGAISTVSRGSQILVEPKQCPGL